jgi:Protein of unknown function (DUF2510).
MAEESPAGWHPDPMSRYEFRYWDGARWTEHVSRGGQTAVDPIEAAPAAADTIEATPVTADTTASPELPSVAVPVASGAAVSPTFSPAAQPQAVATAAAFKLCPHCRAQNATTAEVCPSCGKKYVVKKKWPWVVAAIFLLMVVGFVGCVAVVGTVAKKAVDALNAEQARHAITPAQFNAVKLGSTRVAVVSQLGKPPQDGQLFVQRGFLSDLNSSCIYYNRAGGSFGDRYQFCFENDALRSKNAY